MIVKDKSMNKNSLNLYWAKVDLEKFTNAMSQKRKKDLHVNNLKKKNVMSKKNKIGNR